MIIIDLKWEKIIFVVDLIVNIYLYIFFFTDMFECSLPKQQEH